MKLSKMVVFGLLLSSSFGIMAKEKIESTPLKKPTKSPKETVIKQDTKTVKASTFKFKNVSFDLMESFSGFKDSVESFDNYINMNFKNENSLFPSFKLEYVSNTYPDSNSLTKTKSRNLGLNSDNITNLDINVQHADLVSYYSLKSNTPYSIDLGLGLRQYTGEVSVYQDSQSPISNNVNMTVPITYADFYYSIDGNHSKIGTYLKQSQLIDDSIQDSAIYYSTKIRKVDNLNLIATYAVSSITWEDKSQLANKDLSNFQNDGFNLQLIYTY